ncbi:MAG: hypothetical protein Q9220_005763 [cf. Caloplaca sp. 1 TL-2023]
MPPLKLAYIPEHFSTPLHLSVLHFSLPCHLIPYPTGTGAMVEALRKGEVDIAVGLTEGWVAALSTVGITKQDEKGEERFKIVGTYVETPLLWAISTGAEREDITTLKDGGLKGKNIGVSRLGSGSHVMGSVLADQRGWLDGDKAGEVGKEGKGEGGGGGAFEVVPLGNFENLRKGVNDAEVADFFMWEYFTSKRYYNNDPQTKYPIRQIGEIPTPWSSWKIVARDSLVDSKELEEVLEKINQGIEYFETHVEESVEFITREMDYEEEDAREWIRGVRFAKDVRGVRRETMEMVVSTLKKAGVVKEESRGMEEWVGIWRD